MKVIKEQIHVLEFYYFPFVLDFFLRWIIMGVYRSLSHIKGESDFWIFVLGNLVISGITFFLAYNNIQNLKEKFNFIKNNTYEEKISIVSIVFRIVAIISVVYIITNAIKDQEFYKNFTFKDDGSQFFVPIVVMFVYGIFIMGLSSISFTYKGTEEGVLLERTDQDTASTIGKWFLQFFQRSYQKPILLSEEEVSQNVFLNEYDFKIDRNDNQIVELEGRIRNEAIRIEAYILESVMFGALAFSAFLSIIASERFNITLSERSDIRKGNVEIQDPRLVDSLEVLDNQKMKEIPKDSLNISSSRNDRKQNKTATKNIYKLQTTEIRLFWDDAMAFMNDVLLFNIEDAGRKWENLTRPKNLIMLVMIQTLFCALFFLSVIASRLRYSKVAEEIDNLIRLARSFNDKEEEVHNIVLQGAGQGNEDIRLNLGRRLKGLEIKISNNINKAKALLDQTRPILIYMSVFRNMGVVTFMAILITSCLFFSTTLATIFFMFSVIAYAYESLDTWVRVKKKR